MASAQLLHSDLLSNPFDAHGLPRKWRVRRNLRGTLSRAFQSKAAQTTAKIATSFALKGAISGVFAMAAPAIVPAAAAVGVGAALGGLGATFAKYGIDRYFAHRQGETNKPKLTKMSLLTGVAGSLAGFGIAEYKEEIGAAASWLSQSAVAQKLGSIIFHMPGTLLGAPFKLLFGSAHAAAPDIQESYNLTPTPLRGSPSSLDGFFPPADIGTGEEAVALAEDGSSEACVSLDAILDPASEMRDQIPEAYQADFDYHLKMAPDHPESITHAAYLVNRYADPAVGANMLKKALELGDAKAFDDVKVMQGVSKFSAYYADIDLSQFERGVPSDRACEVKVAAAEVREIQVERPEISPEKSCAFDLLSADVTVSGGTPYVTPTYGDLNCNFSSQGNTFLEPGEKIGIGVPGLYETIAMNGSNQIWPASEVIEGSIGVIKDKVNPVATRVVLDHFNETGETIFRFDDNSGAVDSMASLLNPEYLPPQQYQYAGSSSAVRDMFWQAHLDAANSGHQPTDVLSATSIDAILGMSDASRVQASLTDGIANPPIPNLKPKIPPVPRLKPSIYRGPTLALASS